jgi:adenine phosphoribosyltransferase
VPTLSERLKETIRDIPDFPKEGIVFKDIAPILQDASLMRAIVQRFVEGVEGKVDVVVGMESRGFIFGAPLAMELDAAFVPARKPGKLPYDTIGVEYALEYGTNRLEMHTDAIQPGQKVLIVDDLLATGGTAKATLELVQQLKGEVVGCCFVIELSFLDGAAGLADVPIQSLVHY